MAGIVLDSSVVIALLRPVDKHHAQARQAVAGIDEQVMISTITVAEVLVRPAAISQKEAIEKAGLLREYFGAAIAVTSEVAELAATIRAKTGLSTPDAIISATATLKRATLWSCDARLAKAHRGARLIV